LKKLNGFRIPRALSTTKAGIGCRYAEKRLPVATGTLINGLKHQARIKNRDAVREGPHEKRGAADSGRVAYGKDRERGVPEKAGV